MIQKIHQPSDKNSSWMSPQHILIDHPLKTYILSKTPINSTFLRCSLLGKRFVSQVPGHVSSRRSCRHRQRDTWSPPSVPLLRRDAAPTMRWTGHWWAVHKMPQTATHPPAGGRLDLTGLYSTFLNCTITFKCWMGCTKICIIITYKKCYNQFRSQGKTVNTNVIIYIK